MFFFKFDPMKLVRLWVTNAHIQNKKKKQKKRQKEKKKSKCNNSAENVHFMLWLDQFQKIHQIKAWNYKIDLTNPQNSYNSLNQPFRFSDKATNIWKNVSLVLTLLRKIFFFKFGSLIWKSSAGPSYSARCTIKRFLIKTWLEI